MTQNTAIANVHAGADIDKDRALADHRDGAFHLLASADRRRQLVETTFHDVVEIFSVCFTHCCFTFDLLFSFYMLMVGLVLFSHALGTVAIASSLAGSNGLAVASLSDAGKNQLLPRFATARPPGHVNS